MEQPTKYRVIVDDNFHFTDEDERYTDGEYADYDSAVEKCKEIVDDFLMSALKPGMTPEELRKLYVMFGEDPWITPDAPRRMRFSAWDYAAGRCEELCLAEK
jgi:hypothetical protein